MSIELKRNPSMKYFNANHVHNPKKPNKSK